MASQSYRAAGSVKAFPVEESTTLLMYFFSYFTGDYVPRYESPAFSTSEAVLLSRGVYVNSN